MAKYTRSWLASYRPTMTRRRFVAGGMAGAGAALLAACSGGRGDSGLSLDEAGTSRKPGSVWLAKNDWKLADETKAAKRGGIYRGYMEADQLGHFDALTLASSQVPFRDHVYEMLMAQKRGPGVEPGSKEASTPIGALAEGWELSPDGLTVTFTMRKNVKWQNVPPVNGRVMDIDDWKTSTERFLAEGFYRTDIGSLLDRFDFPDPSHMVWKLKFPYAPIITRIHSDFWAYIIQSKELNSNKTLAESTAIGTGYKILDKNQPSISMEYRKHPEYWGGDPFIERWHAPIIPEYSNRYAQFVSGNLVDFTPTARDVLLLAKDAPNAVIVAEAIPEDRATRYQLGRFSPPDSPLQDPRVRVAIRRSIDFNSIGEFLSNKAEFESNGIPVELNTMTHLPPNPAYWLDPEKGELGKVSENYLYNPTEAKRLTAAAGHPDPIPLYMPTQLTRGEFTEEDGLVIDSFKATGTFNLNVEGFPNAQEYRKYRIEKQFDGMAGTELGSNNDPDYFITRDYSTAGPWGAEQQFPSPRIDELQRAQRSALDLDKRYEVLKEFQIYMGEWMSLIPGRAQFTTFRVRWPWLHNSNWGEPIVNLPEGRPGWGGHLHWLDAEMPNRETGST